MNGGCSVLIPNPLGPRAGEYYLLSKEDQSVKEEAKVVNGPVNLGGRLGRIVKLPDGSGRVETWGGTSRGWVHGGADVPAIMRAAPALPQRLIEYGVPEQDWPPAMLEKWRRTEKSKQK
jgi:hypothetical protein